MLQKKALITGASEGIGRSIAHKLAREHFTLTLVARNQQRLESLLKELGGSPHQILVADLTNPTDFQKIEEHLQTHHYDLLINNAGAGVNGAFANVDLEKILSIFHLNCEALIRLSHAFLRQAQKGDALVNISSTLAFLPLPYSGTYAATKAFVTAFSEALWFENRKRDVYVMNLCPGLTRTEFMKRSGGRDLSPPSWMFQSSTTVAELMWKALQKRCRPTVICGKRNHIFAFFSRLLTRKRLVQMMGSIG